MGRDKPIRVEPTPRGLGLYRRQGREGFFFIKNWSHLARKHPQAFEKGGQFDEWIKKADGSVVTSMAEAKAYCLRRNAELETRKLALKQDFVEYGPEDLEAISQQLADKWIRARQRGVNLQSMNLARWRIMTRVIGKTGTNIPSDKNIFAYVGTDEEIAASAGPIQLVTPQAVEDEAAKVERLCWDDGFRPNQAQLTTIFNRMRCLVQTHLSHAEEDRERGLVVPPDPSMPVKGLTWESLLQAKASEGMAQGTLTGLKKALERLENWLKEQLSLRLPTTIDTQVALAYRAWLVGPESGLAHSTIGKELRLINSAFNAAERQGLIQANSFQNLPKDRRASMNQKLQARKTVEANKILSVEDVAHIHGRMARDKHGRRDPGYDLFYLQAITGTRIQEVAGLRKCDFTKRTFKGRSFYCIEIRAWPGRGFGVMGEHGGLKTAHSERIIPLPSVAKKIWESYSDALSEEPAFPNEQPSNGNGRWGDNLARRLRSKIPGFPGTHAWRETLINNLLNSSEPDRIVQMVTGKASRSPLSQYTSDDLPSMAKAIERHVTLLKLPRYVEALEGALDDQALVSRGAM